MAEQVHTVRVKFDSRKAESNAKSFDRQMSRMDKKAGGLSSTMGKLGGVLAAVGLAKITGEMFQTINATERMKASLETMTGSTENANRAFKALQEFATTTPFTVDQSVQAFIKMKSLGLEPTQDALTSFGNTASAMGKDMNQMIEAVADASTMEFERLKEFGIKARQEGENVSFTFQGVTTTVGKNSQEIVDYLQQIGNTEFAGAMEKQMARLPGKVSNLQDKIENLWRALGDSGATKAFGAVIDTVSNGIGEITEMFETGFAQENMKIWMEAFVAPIQEAFDQVQEMWMNMTGGMDSQWGETVTRWIDRGSEFLDWMALIPMAWQATVTTLLELGGAAFKNIGDSFRVLGLQFDVVWEGISHAGSVVWNTLRLGFAEMKDWVLGGLSDMLNSLAGMLVNLPFGAEMAGQLYSAAAAMDQAANSAAGIREEMAQNKTAHEAQVKALQGEQAALLNHTRTRMAAAKSNASAAWLEVAAAKGAIDAKQEEAQALRDAAGAGEDAAAVLDELAESENEVAASTGLTAKAIAKLDKDTKSLEKQLQPLLDKMKGITEEERNMMTATNLVDEAMRLGLIHTVEEATELLKLLEEEMGATSSEMDLMQTAMERGVEFLTDQFSSMWQTFLTEGQASFEGLEKGFTALLANLVHTASTETIMIEVKKGMDGEDMDWGSMADAGAMMAGTMGGTALGGGGQGAAIGSAIGAIAGSYFGPIGTMVGGMLGGMVGGMFDSDRPALMDVSGTSRAHMSKSDNDSQYESDLGTLFVRSRRMGGQAAVDKLMEQVTGFDNAVAEWLTDSQLADVQERLKGWQLMVEAETMTSEQFIEGRMAIILGALDKGIQDFVGEGGTVEEMTERLFMAFQADKIMQDNPDVFGERTIGEFLTLTEMAKEPGEGLASVMERLVMAMNQAYMATEVLADYTGTDLGEAFRKFQDEQTRSTAEWLQMSGENVRNLVEEFDGSSSGLAAISNAVQERYQLELQYIGEIRGLIDSISERLSGTRDRIEETLNPKVAEDYYLELQTLKDQLTLASSPEEIDRITQAMNAAAGALFDIVAPENQAEAGAYLQTYLTEAEAKATSMLEAMEATALADSNQLRADLGEWMTTVGDPMALAAVELGVAAEALQEAAANLGGGGETGMPPGWFIDPDTGQPVYGGNADSKNINQTGSIDESVVVNNSAAMQEGANALAREGAAYRQATADNAAAARALAQAVRSIPSRIYLVPQGKGEYV